MSWKSRFKRAYKARLIIVGLILGLVGWFLLGIVLFGNLFEDELLAAERLLETPSFLWIFRAVIIVFMAILVWKHRWLDSAWERPAFRQAACIFGAIGLAGWIAGLISLAL